MHLPLMVAGKIQGLVRLFCCAEHMHVCLWQKIANLVVQMKVDLVRDRPFQNLVTYQISTPDVHDHLQTRPAEMLNRQPMQRRLLPKSFQKARLPFPDWKRLEEVIGCYHESCLWKPLQAALLQSPREEVQPAVKTNVEAGIRGNVQRPNVEAQGVAEDLSGIQTMRPLTLIRDHAPEAEAQVRSQGHTVQELACPGAKAVLALRDEEDRLPGRTFAAA
mmetsp:Transcript_19373/g.36394  ORF Transcript_19373/g.36394 Transcript_19373/m.36394 type:complete len:219 (+) Transcript_19373:245-901(+)